MTINTFDGLAKWFQANQKDDKPSPHWTLYGGSWGEKEVRLLSNSRIDDSEKSLAFLVDSIRIMNNPDGTKFRILLYPHNAPNNYTATVHVQIYENGANKPSSAGQMAGIGSLPAIQDIETRIAEKVELALLKAENEQLRNGGENGTIWERVLGIIAESPHLSAAVGSLVNGILLKADPALAGNLVQPAPVTGTPSADNGAAPEDQQAAFVDNINQVCSALGVDAVTLAARLRQIVQANPLAAKQIILNPEIIQPTI